MLHIAILLFIKSDEIEDFVTCVLGIVKSAVWVFKVSVLPLVANLLIKRNCSMLRNSREWFNFSKILYGLTE